MKRGTENLLKFQHLQRDLGLAEYEAVGLLQALWNKTDINCPKGDIGRLSNEDIAVILDWRRDPDELIAALVRRRWIDEHPVFRLVIHDWFDHCENTTHRKVARAKEYFADGRAPKLGGLGKEQDDIVSFYAREAKKNTNVITFENKDKKRDHICAENLHSLTPTDTDTYADTYSDTEPIPQSVGRSAISSVSDLSASAILSAKRPRSELFERLLRVSGDPPQYREWWRSVGALMVQHEGRSVITEAIEYAEKCRDPVASKRKGLGALDNPGAYIASKCKAHLSPYSVSLPAKPTRAIQ